MSLGDALFGKKEHKIGLVKNSKVNSPAFSKNANVFSGGIYKTKKDLRGKLGSLKTMKVKGNILKKEEWTTLMTDMVKARHGKITVGQLERDLYLKKHIPQRERVRIMTWAKKNFVKTDSTQPINNRSARKVDAKQTLKDQSHLSPKKEWKRKGYAMGQKEGENSLGMKDAGYKGGHSVGIGNMETGSSSHSVNGDKSQGMVQSGGNNVTRNVPRGAGGSSLNLGAQPKRTGL